ncbi:hypothetical protein SISNIDRAFT_449764 [Sistotremastrum niveocremeum HHB9708]|uniref:Uncharacterized protein n=1 Tax=Sistotremastrum niveocremeum HHB9708 TaxID=1314777 RepID=A0A164YM00_9AGAM|nr:hypothetical protein SISNIDRAFT_449764 [Sistotremastrum niveocremeum HHB9708]
MARVDENVPPDARPVGPASAKRKKTRLPRQQSSGTIGAARKAESVLRIELSDMGSHSGLLTPPASRNQSHVRMLSPPPESQLQQERKAKVSLSTSASKKRPRPVNSIPSFNEASSSSTPITGGPDTPNPRAKKQPKTIAAQLSIATPPSTQPTTVGIKRGHSRTHSGASTQPPSPAQPSQASVKPQRRKSKSPRISYSPPASPSVAVRARTPVRVPYEPPAEQFTPPRIVYSPAPGKLTTARRATAKKPNSKARSATPQPLKLVERRITGSLPPPEIDLTLPLPPASPGEDPLLLKGPAVKRRSQLVKDQPYDEDSLLNELDEPGNTTSYFGDAPLASEGTFLLNQSIPFLPLSSPTRPSRHTKTTSSDAADDTFISKKRVLFKDLDRGSDDGDVTAPVINSSPPRSQLQGQGSPILSQRDEVESNTQPEEFPYDANANAMDAGFASDSDDDGQPIPTDIVPSSDPEEDEFEPVNIRASKSPASRRQTLHDPFESASVRSPRAVDHYKEYTLPLELEDDGPNTSAERIRPGSPHPLKSISFLPPSSEPPSSSPEREERNDSGILNGMPESPSRPSSRERTPVRRRTLSEMADYLDSQRKKSPSPHIRSKSRALDDEADDIEDGPALNHAIRVAEIVSEPMATPPSHAAPDDSDSEAEISEEEMPEVELYEEPEQEPLETLEDNTMPAILIEEADQAENTASSVAAEEAKISATQEDAPETPPKISGSSMASSDPSTLPPSSPPSSLLPSPEIQELLSAGNPNTLDYHNDSHSESHITHNTLPFLDLSSRPSPQKRPTLPLLSIPRSPSIIHSPNPGLLTPQNPVHTFDEEADESDADLEAAPDDVVRISSKDPSAAARAVAILKMHHDYEEDIRRSQAYARRKSATPRTPEQRARASRLHGVSTSGIKKRTLETPRVAAVGSPAALRELLHEAEASIAGTPRPLRGDVVSEASHTPLPLRFSFPTREEVAPPAGGEDLPREWTKSDWKNLDRCFSDERLARGANGIMADVDQVDPEDVVDRYTTEVGPIDHEEWTREKLLSRVLALRSKQQAGQGAPPTPLRAQRGPAILVPDFTPSPASRFTSQIPPRTSLEKTSATPVLPASLLAPRYSHLHDEAIVSTPVAPPKRTEKPKEPPTFKVPATPVRSGSKSSTPAPPVSTTKRVLSYIGSFISKNPPPATQPSKRVIEPGPPALPPPEMTQISRGPVTTPTRPPPEKIVPPKELVTLQHTSPPPSAIPRLAKPKPAKRLVDLNHVELVEKEEDFARRERKASTGSVKDLINSFNSMDKQANRELKRPQSLGNIGATSRMQEPRSRTVSTTFPPRWRL